TPPDFNFSPAWHLPFPVLGDAFALLSKSHGWQYLAVIIPMGLFNVIGSLQKPRIRRSRRRPLRNPPQPARQRPGLVARSALRISLPHHHLHRPPRLENHGRPRRLLHPQRRRHRPALPRRRRHPHPTSDAP